MEDDLRQLLNQMSERVCRLVLSGAMTLDAARRLPASPHVSREYVDAIVREAGHMPEDLRRAFLSGGMTVRQVRAELLRRLVEQGKLAQGDAATFGACSVDLGTIRSYAS